MQGRVLIIAGSDSGGGAGIQADIKTVTALGGYGMTAITALTAQNTTGVQGIEAVPPAFVAEQIVSVLTDIGADSVKTGMLHRADVITSVCEALDQHAPGVPMVVDPVMVAKGGARLLDEAAAEALKTGLLPRTFIATPNLPEAEVLLGTEISDPAEMGDAARALLDLGPRAVLLKGGHLTGDTVADVLARPEGVESFEGPRIVTPHTHGTGCTLASAIATGIAQGMGLQEAVRRARAYVRRAIETAPGLGSGNGPLNHGHTVRPFPGD